ncbi:MAG TPA: hypothetical protein VIS29_03395, partial [Streptomyces sp.]
PFLTLGGIVAARRAGRGPAAMLATATAASMAFPYLFLVGYAAPRFLLPAYALLAVPVAECVVRVLRPAGLAALVLAVALAGHLAVQFTVLSQVAARSHATSAQYAAVAGALHRLGISPPCVLSGDDAVPVAYYAGCTSRQTSGHDTSATPADIRAFAGTMPTAVLVTGRDRPPDYARDWRPVPLPHAPGTEPYRSYLPPSGPRRSGGSTAFTRP